MLFYGLWMSRWKTGSDIAHQWRKGLLRTSAVRPHSDCCCHSGQLVLETQLCLGGLLDHVWSEKARTFSWEWRVCYMRWYAAYIWRLIFIGSKLQMHDNSDTWANTQGCLTSACQPQRWLFVPATERQKHVPPVGHSGSWTDFQSPHALAWSPWAFVTQ